MYYEDDFYDEPSEFDEQIKKDYKVKKRECDRAILEADAKVKDTKLKKLLEPYKLILWIPKRVDRFGPKCDKCDHNRLVKITLPSGRIVMDDCLCSLNEATLHYPCKVLLVELSDEYGDVRAWYRECGLNGDEYYTLEGALRTCTYPNLVQPGTSFEILEKKGDQSGMLFSSKEECQAYCDYLNKKAGIPDGPLYYRNGERWSPEEQEE